MHKQVYGYIFCLGYIIFFVIIISTNALRNILFKKM